MRIDLWFWFGAMVVVLLAGSLHTWPRPHGNARGARTWGLWAPLVLLLLGLASLVAGLAWRARFAGAWPGKTSADGVAMLAGGTLVILTWVLINGSRRPKAGSTCPGGAVAEALAMFGTGLLVLLAIAAAWRTPAPGFSAQASSLLFGLTVIAASVGLGAWMPALADAAWGLRPTNRHPGNDEGSLPPGLEAMRAGYPWLTLAWLLGAAWSLAAMAALWRGLPPEAWLLAAWLLAGIYLIAAWGPTRLPRWALLLLTICGMVAALLQAWQAPLLLP